MQPQGWYPDPAGGDRLRWWSGQEWTDNTVPRAGTPEAVARRRRVWPWIVGGVVVLLALTGVSLALVLPRVIGTFTKPIDAANLYLRDQRDGRLPAAYAELCTTIHNELPYDQYVERIQAEEGQGGHLVRFNVHQANVQFGHEDEAVVDVDVTTTRGQDAVQARMVKESGHWRWCGSRPTPKSKGIFIHVP